MRFVPIVWLILSISVTLAGHAHGQFAHEMKAITSFVVTAVPVA